MMLNFELYEALKDHVGEEGARLIAQRLPEPEAMATKADLERLENAVVAQILELKAETRSWMLAFFIPLWVGVYLTLGAIIVTNVL